eukprot:Awhi_evm1s7554
MPLTIVCNAFPPSRSVEREALEELRLLQSIVLMEVFYPHLIVIAFSSCFHILTDIVHISNILIGNSKRHFIHVCPTAANANANANTNTNTLANTNTNTNC